MNPDKWYDKGELTLLLGIALLGLFFVRAAVSAITAPVMVGMIVGTLVAITVFFAIARFFLRARVAAHNGSAILCWNIALLGYICLFVSSWIVLTASATATAQSPVVEQSLVPKQITNPDFVKNPTAYLVDRENTVSSDIPVQRALWVEDVVADPYSPLPGRNMLIVSYVIEKAGTQILDFDYLRIPGVGYPTNIFAPDTPHDWYESLQGQCWQQGQTSVLRQNLLHKIVYVVDANEDERGLTMYRLLLQTDTSESDSLQDVSALVIGNGYATYHAWSTMRFGPNYPLLYESGLKDVEEVARLAGKGSWGTCRN